MSFPTAVNDIVEVTVRGEAEGQEIENVFHYQVTNQDEDGDSATFLSGFHDVWSANFLPLLSELYFLMSITMKRVTGITGTPPHEVTLTYDAVDVVWGASDERGTKDTAALPSFVAATTRKLTAGAASTQYGLDAGVVTGPEKVFKGGFRLGPIVENDTIDGSVIYLTDDARDAVEAAADELVIVTGTSGSDVVEARLLVLSMLRGNVIRQDDTPKNVFAWQVVTDMRTNLYLGSQVSRKFRGVGG